MESLLILREISNNIEKLYQTLEKRANMTVVEESSPNMIESCDSVELISNDSTSRTTAIMSPHLMNPADTDGTGQNGFDQCKDRLKSLFQLSNQQLETKFDYCQRVEIALQDGLDKYLKSRILNHFNDDSQSKNTNNRCLEVNFGGKYISLESDIINNPAIKYNLFTELFHPRWETVLPRDRQGRMYFELDYKWVEPILDAYAIAGITINQSTNNIEISMDDVTELHKNDITTSCKRHLMENFALIASSTPTRKISFKISSKLQRLMLTDDLTNRLHVALTDALQRTNVCAMHSVDCFEYELEPSQWLVLWKRESPHNRLPPFTKGKPLVAIVHEHDTNIIHGIIFTTNTTGEVFLVRGKQDIDDRIDPFHGYCPISNKQATANEGHFELLSCGLLRITLTHPAAESDNQKILYYELNIIENPHRCYRPKVWASAENFTTKTLQRNMEEINVESSITTGVWYRGGCSNISTIEFFTLNVTVSERPKLYEAVHHFDDRWKLIFPEISHSTNSFQAIEILQSSMHAIHNSLTQACEQTGKGLECKYHEAHLIQSFVCEQNLRVPIVYPHTDAVTEPPLWMARIHAIYDRIATQASPTAKLAQTNDIVYFNVGGETVCLLKSSIAYAIPGSQLAIRVLGEWTEQYSTMDEDQRLLIVSAHNK